MYDADEPRHLTVVVDITIRMSWLAALKLRLAGAQYVQGYVDRIIEDHLAQPQGDD